ncbi:unnamed protein product [Macrosiphum euphorbiae]|uniref:LAGLIDADG homing endonuclease n=1 Tax=Macrosiphum euphorbiae TaxID=13131 RepID=A0AAV0XZU2_9HEMI|nr:unnamed protein product [Macrosiphum euphorbiae]
MYNWLLPRTIFTSQRKNSLEHEFNSYSTNTNTHATWVCTVCFDRSCKKTGKKVISNTKNRFLGWIGLRYIKYKRPKEIRRITEKHLEPPSTHERLTIQTFDDTESFTLTYTVYELF